MFWIIISAVCLVLAIPIVIAVIEPRMPEYDTVRLTDSDPSLRLLFFSDVHVDMCFVPAEYICRRIRERLESGPAKASGGLLLRVFIRRAQSAAVGSGAAPAALFQAVRRYHALHGAIPLPPQELFCDTDINEIPG